MSNNHNRSNSRPSRHDGDDDDLQGSSASDNMQQSAEQMQAAPANGN